MKEKILQIIMVVVFVCGLLVFLYPKFTEWKAACETVKTIEVFEQNLTEKKCEKENDSEIVENKQENLDKNKDKIKKESIEYK